MIKKYPTPYEIQEVLNSAGISRNLVNEFAQERGVFLINASKDSLVEELSSHLYEYSDLEVIRSLAYQSSGKQFLSGFSVSATKGFNLESLYDRVREYGLLETKGYKLKAVTKKTKDNIVVYHGEIEYTKRKSGKIEFLQNEKFATDFYFYERKSGVWQVEVDGSTSSDGKEVMRLIGIAIQDTTGEIESLEIDNLETSNVITFFDRLAKEGLDAKEWKISDIKQLTFKKRKNMLLDTEDNEDTEEAEDDDLSTVGSEELGGISQAVLDGKNLREHPFVIQAERDGCVFTAMTYEFENILKSSVIAIKAEFKGSPKIFEVSIVSTSKIEGINKKKVCYQETQEYKRILSSLFWNNAKKIYSELKKIVGLVTLFFCYIYLMFLQLNQLDIK